MVVFMVLLRNILNFLGWSDGCLLAVKTIFKSSLLKPQILFILYAFWYTEPSRRGKKALGNGSAALSRLMYGPVHFQGPARDEQF